MQRGTAGGATVQRHAIRPVQAGRSAQHVQVPGALGRQQLAEHLDETRDFGTPRGFWDEQISSRSYGQHSLDPVGREAVTRGFFEVKTEVRNLLLQGAALAESDAGSVSSDGSFGTAAVPTVGGGGAGARARACVCRPFSSPTHSSIQNRQVIVANRLHARSAGALQI